MTHPDSLSFNVVGGILFFHLIIMYEVEEFHGTVSTWPGGGAYGGSGGGGGGGGDRTVGLG